LTPWAHTQCWPSPLVGRSRFVAAEPGPVVDDRGSLSIIATASYAELPHPSVILVPGGPGAFKALSDTALLGWITQAHEHTRWTTSVCGGSFLLTAAGRLKGSRATSHWGWLEYSACHLRRDLPLGR
jgi:putative intracellular protease/amidase